MRYLKFLLCMTHFYCMSAQLGGRVDQPGYSLEDLQNLTDQQLSEFQKLPNDVARIIRILVQGVITLDERLAAASTKYDALYVTQDETNRELESLQHHIYGQVDLNLNPRDMPIFDETRRETISLLESIDNIIRACTGSAIANLVRLVINGDPSTQENMSQIAKTLNFSLNKLELTVSDLKTHVEEVENQAYTKGADLTTLTDMINAILPAIETRMEQRYTRLLQEYIHNQTGLQPDDVSTKGITLSGQESTGPIKRCQGTDSSDQCTSSYNSDREAEIENSLAQTYTGRYCNATSLSVLQGIELRRIPMRRSAVFGSWMKDSYCSTPKVWMLSGFKKLTQLIEYASQQAFSTNAHPSSHTLPFTCGESGHLIFNNTLLCGGYRTDIIYSYHLTSGHRHEITIPVTTKTKRHAKFGYLFGGHVDILSDKDGVWILYSSHLSNGNVIISKLDPLSWEIVLTRDVSVQQRSIMNAFMICGNLYAVERDKSNRSLTARAIYSVLSNISRPTGDFILESNQNTVMVMAEFNHVTGELYAWNFEGMTEAVMKRYRLTFS